SHRRSLTATAKPAGGKRSSLTLSDQVLALATGKTQREIAAACKGARPNHVAAAVARHKRAGRLEERDGKLYATPSTDTVQRAAVRQQNKTSVRPILKRSRPARLTEIGPPPPVGKVPSAAAVRCRQI